MCVNFLLFATCICLATSSSWEDDLESVREQFRHRLVVLTAIPNELESLIGEYEKSPSDDIAANSARIFSPQRLHKMDKFSGTHNAVSLNFFEFALNLGFDDVYGCLGLLRNIAFRPDWIYLHRSETTLLRRCLSRLVEDLDVEFVRDAMLRTDMIEPGSEFLKHAIDIAYSPILEKAKRLSQLSLSASVPTELFQTFLRNMLAANETTLSHEIARALAESSPSDLVLQMDDLQRDYWE